MCGGLNLVFSALDPFIAQFHSDGAALLWSAAGLLLPFASMALLFYGKGLWKSMLTVAGYSFVESFGFLILLLFFDFDYTARNDALELLVNTPLDLLFFGVALYLFLRSLRKQNAMIDLTKTGVALYAMVVLSTAVLSPHCL